MTVQVTVELSETVFSALRQTPAAFVHEMRLAAAIKWYELGRLSQGKAAEVAGVSRQEFLHSLARYDLSPFQVTPEELAEELARD
jgi:predicted HTH domain antitoxin